MYQIARCLWLPTVLVVLLSASVLRATDFDNGVAGYYKQDVVIFPAVIRGNEIITPVGEYHSTIVAQPRVAGDPIGNNTSITDTEFVGLVIVNLIPGAVCQYDSMHIHMAQCFSGGFIDELDDGGVPNFTINTAARWTRSSVGTERAAAPGPRNYYSYEWQQQVNAAAPARRMLDAYTNSLAIVAYQEVRAEERPQYFSRPAGEDVDMLHSAADENIALLFVGDDTDVFWLRGFPIFVRAQRHYQDTERMYATLTGAGYGYAAADIRVYYHDGTRPPGGVVGDFPIDGAATEANFNAFFTAPPRAIAGQDDQVFVWTSDHGGLFLTITGLISMKLPLEPDGGLGPAVELAFDLHPEYLESIDLCRVLEDPYIEVEFLDLAGTIQVEVFINDVSIGFIDETVRKLTVPPELLLSMSPTIIRFEGESEAVAVGDFTLHNGEYARYLCIPADVNGDFVADEGDIMPFVLTLVDPFMASVEELCAADTNGDCGVDGNDIGLFVDEVLSP